MELLLFHFYIHLLIFSICFHNVHLRMSAPVIHVKNLKTSNLEVRDTVVRAPKEPLQLVCTVDANSRTGDANTPIVLEWTKSNFDSRSPPWPIPMVGGPIKSTMVKERINNTATRISMSAVTFDDAGTYQCVWEGRSAILTVHIYSVSDVVNVTVNVTKVPEKTGNIEYKKAEFEVLKDGEKIEVSCACEVGKPSAVSSLVIKWKGGLLKKRALLYDSVSVMNETERKSWNHLRIKEAIGEPGWVGKYSCFCNIVSGESAGGVAYIHSPPVLAKFAMSKRVEEGNRVEVNCYVSAYPPIRDNSLVWRKNNETWVPRKGIRFENRTAGRDVMIIDNVVVADRGIYSCSAENSLGSDTSMVIIRVKNRMAALWPFLGILLELIILVVIIVMYERKRAEMKAADREEEADDMLQEDSYDNPRMDGNNDNVRQRPGKT